MVIVGNLVGVVFIAFSVVAVRVAAVTVTVVVVVVVSHRNTSHHLRLHMPIKYVCKHLPNITKTLYAIL